MERMERMTRQKIVKNEKGTHIPDPDSPFEEDIIPISLISSLAVSSTLNFHEVKRNKPDSPNQPNRNRH